jgi:hypothetical protein
MRRGVYRLDYGGMAELTACTADGVVVMRLLVRDDLYREEHQRAVHEALDRADPGARDVEGGVIRVVRDDDAPADPQYYFRDRWYWMGQVVHCGRAEFHVRALDLAAALGVERLTLVRFVAGRTVSPAWLPVALDAYFRPRLQELEPHRAARLLSLLTKLSEEFEQRQREDVEYADQWAADRPTLPPGLSTIAPPARPALRLHGSRSV